MEVETEQAFEELGRSLQKLSPNAYATLILHRCEGLTLQQIGDLWGVTRERARQLEARLTDRLREFLRRELPDFAQLSFNVDEP